MSDRIVTPIIALGLAFLIWMYTRSRDQETLDRFPVPVEIQVNSGQADQYELEVNSSVSQVPISFVGPPSRIRELRTMLQQGTMRIQRIVTVPEDRTAEAMYDELVRVEVSQVPVPPGVQAYVAEGQNRIAVTLRRLMEKRLPVRLTSTAGDRLEQVVVEPESVLVRGPKEVLEREEYIPTKLWTVPNRPGATQPLVQETPVQVPLVKELGRRAVRAEPPVVQVRFTVKPDQKLRDLADVPVHFLCPANFPYRPQYTSERAGKITLKVKGPSSEERPAAAVYVDLTARKFGAGLHAEEPLRVQLPPGFQLAQEPPRLASFQLVPLETAVKPTGAPFAP